MSEYPAEKDVLAELIWNTSRADEGTISATGANIIAREIRERFGVQQVWCVAYDSDTPFMDGTHAPCRMADQSYEQALTNYELLKQEKRAPKRSLRIETRFVTEWTRVTPPGVGDTE